VLLAIAYVLLAAAVIAHERRRAAALRLDQLSIASLFFLANIAAPAAIIHLLVDGGLVRPASVGVFPVLENVYQHLTGPEEWTVFAGSCLAFIGLAAGYRVGAGSTDAERAIAKTSTRTVLAWGGVGAVLFLAMLSFGNALYPGDPVRGLLLSTFYRAEDPVFAFDRGGFPALAYILTHTFLLIALLGFGLATEHPRGRRLILTLAVVFTATAAVASGARRPVLIVALVLWIYAANRAHSYRLKGLAVILAASVPLLYFGKAFLRGVGTGDAVGLDDSVPWLNQVLVAASEIGISHVESLGTISLYHGGPRLGMDHALSVLRFVPDNLGMRIDWPARIVRISTAYLTGDPNQQDAPPGYIGQCWIDLPVLGFLVLPALHGMFFGWIERLFGRLDLKRSPAHLLAYVVLGYLVALPLNSGSLDFVFSIDVAATVLLLLVLGATTGAWSRAPASDG
jgi:hypothetical protein